MERTKAYMYLRLLRDDGDEGESNSITIQRELIKSYADKAGFKRDTKRKRKSMIDWKRIPKIDAHIHVMPEEVIESNKVQGGKFIEYGAVEDYIPIMETYYIQKAFIMPFNDPYMLSQDYTLESVHKNLHELIAPYKGQLYAFADVDVWRTIEDTIKELDCILEMDGFIGIKLHANNAGYPIDGSYYEKIFQYAEDKGVLLEIHSYPRKSMNDDVCAPARIHRMMKKYPKVRVSIAHLGGFQIEEFVGTRAYFNLSAALTDLVDVYGIQKTNRILRDLGVDQLVFASDYPDNRKLEPRKIYDTYFDILGQMDFTQEESEKICMHNALRMLESMEK